MATEQIDCPLCMNTVRVVFRGYPGYKEPDRFDIARCAECDTNFVLLGDYDLGGLYDAIYRQVEDIPGYSRYARYAQRVLREQDPLEFLAHEEVVYWGIREHLGAAGRTSQSLILEVGSGLGYLTYALNKSGYKAMGLDKSETAVREATRRFGGHYVAADVFDYSRAEIGTFDFVVMAEVIEHLPVLEPFLKLASIF